MGDCMSYPDKAMYFIKGYSFKDKQELYTNGAELVPMFRVEQMLEHYLPRWIPVSERLPDKPGRYFVSSGILMSDDYFDGKKFKFYDGGLAVVWMPLPEPYKPPLPKFADNDTAQPGLIPAT